MTKTTITCTARNCKYHDQTDCELKNVTIDKTGRCCMYSVMTKADWVEPVFKGSLEERRNNLDMV